MQKVLKSVFLSITCKHNSTCAQACIGLLLTLFQAAFGLPIAFSESVEGSVIEMKPTVSVPGDNVVSPKA